MLLDEVTATVPDTVHGDAERVIVWAGSNDVLHERTTDDAGQDIGELLAAVEVGSTFIFGTLGLGPASDGSLGFFFFAQVLPEDMREALAWARSIPVRGTHYVPTILDFYGV